MYTTTQHQDAKGKLKVFKFVATIEVVAVNEESARLKFDHIKPKLIGPVWKLKKERKKEQTV